MKVLVCGGRDYLDTEAVFLALDRVHGSRPIEMVISGGATGADSLAEEWAESRRVHCAVIKAQWRANGRAAGPKRNQSMLLLGPDLVVAFPGGNGTDDMVRKARAANVEVWQL